MEIAISACPNDTYLFYGWAAGAIESQIKATITYADIEQLNNFALAHQFPLIKLSFPCFAKASTYYQLLTIGSALGFNCGPKLVAKKPLTFSELSSKTLIFPGEETTAHYLYKQLLPTPKKSLFAPYHDILHLVEQGVGDCGIIIHETRFTFEGAGFFQVADLGELWHEVMQLPLPLGGLAIARHLPSVIKDEVVATLTRSLHYAKTNPSGLFPFISKLAQEKKEVIFKQHIDLYVTSETETLSPKGVLAIETLLNFKLPQKWLYEKSTDLICSIQ